MDEKVKKLLKKFPFITIAQFCEEEIIGIIQNQDDLLTSIYDYNRIQSEDLRKKFLELGDVWFNESNQKIPINIFLKQEFVEFKPYIRTYSSKEFHIIAGPIVNLGEMAKIRSKRRSIQLVRKV